MKTENIIAVFKEYLNDNTNYAILIDGSWGSGKTFFWKNELLIIAEKEKLKPLYLSLNGIATISDLERNLFVKLIPFISKNNAAFNAIKNIASGVLNYFTGSKIDDIIKGIGIDSFNLSNYIICFDDLERCQVPIKEVLGFINNFVEHKGLKTIILADERNIDRQSQSVEYDSIKEKVIGRVFKYEADVKEVFKFLIDKESDINFQKFLTKHLDYIEGLLVEYQIQNLRVVKYYLQSLKRLCRLIENDEEKFIKEVLLFSLCISCEFKNGNLKSSDCKDYKQLDIGSIFFARRMLRHSSSEKQADEKDYVDEFYDKYLSTREDDFCFYASIYKYILTGYLDNSELLSEIKERYPKLEKEENIAFVNAFTHAFRKLSEEEFENNFQKAIQHVRAGVYSIYDYVQIADFLYFFSENGITKLNEQEIDTLIKHGLDIAARRKELNERTIENILHFPKNNPKVAELVQLVNHYHMKIKKEQFIAQTQEFVNAVKSNNDTLLNSKFDEYYMSKDLFQYLDADSLFESILQSTNGQIDNFTRAMKRRYSSINIGEFLSEDYECLCKLNDMIKSNLVEQEVKQPRKFLLYELSKELEQILHKLNNT